MAIKTDNPSEVGVHTFEVAGLGKGPFRCVGFVERVGPIMLPGGGQVGAPGQPMGSCDYCGNGIKTCCVIKSADGKVFEVGTTCVNKTDDKGLIREYKNRPEYREHQRKIRHAREQRKIDEIPVLIEMHKATLNATPHPYEKQADEGLTMMDFANWMMDHAGNSGKCKLHSTLSKLGKLDPAKASENKQAIAAAKAAAEAKRAEAERAVAAEKAAREERIERAAEDNQWLRTALDKCDSGDFINDMYHRLKSTPLADFSERQIEVLRDVYAKLAGRRNSKAYNAACDEFDEKANLWDDHSQ